MPTSPTPEGRIVCLIDPDPPVCSALRWLLGTYGLDLVTFESAEAFLAAGELGSIVLLIIEQRLPRMTGVELLETLRERGLGAPALLLTSNADLPTATRARRSGAVDVLEKPFVSDAVVMRALAAVRAQEAVPQRHTGEG